MKRMTALTKMWWKRWTKPRPKTFRDADVMNAVSPEPTLWRPVDPPHSGHLLR